MFVVLFLPDLASAQNVPKPGSEGGESSKLLKAIAAVLYSIVVTVFGWLVYVGGELLHIGLNDFVFAFQSNYLNIFGVAIDYLWSVVRDLINLTFIFGLIYIGFRLIFDAEDTRARRALVMLIGAALLVNFSLFFAKTVVDVSNLTAFEVAKGLTVLSGDSSDNVSDQFMNVLGIQSVLNLDGNFKSAEAKMTEFDDGGAFAYVFGIMILFFVAAFVFAAGGILLIIRFVSLCLYMIFAPIMFLGWVIPAFANASRKWWHGFLNQAFIAPAYIFMLYISMYILSAISSNPQLGSTSYIDAFSASSGASLSGDNSGVSAAAAFAFFGLAIGFLIASLIVAKKMGAVGADATIRVGQNLRRRGQGLVYRNTAGRIANQASEKLNRLAADDGQSGRSRLSRTLRGGARLVAGRAAVQQGLSAARNYGAGGVGLAEAEKRSKDAKRFMAGEDSKARLKAEREAAIKTMDDTTASTTDLEEAFDSLGKTLREMSLDEKNKLGIDKLTDQRMAAHLTDNDISDLEKTGDYSSHQIQQIKDARSGAFETIANQGSLIDPSRNPSAGNSAFQERQRQKLMRRDVQQVGKMPVSVFKNSSMAAHITPQALEQRMRNGGVSNDDLRDIRANLNSHIATITDPAEKTRVQNTWRNWQNRSEYGAQLGLSV